jgi:periplasmic divalent cation tolerance protein
MTACLFQVMCGSEAEARRIAEAVLGEGLAAAANILGPASSLYRWRGRIEAASETLLLIKTAERHREALLARIASLHSYACPSIIVLPIAAGHAGYLTWLDEQPGQ